MKYNSVISKEVECWVDEDATKYMFEDHTQTKTLNNGICNHNMLSDSTYSIRCTGQNYKKIMKKGDWLVFVGSGSKFSPYKTGQKYQLFEDYDGSNSLCLSNIPIKQWERHTYYRNKNNKKYGKRQYFFVTLQEYREKQLDKILI